MKRMILFVGFLIAFSFTASSLFAADGDLIVNNKVGIGTTSPTSKLDIANDLTAANFTSGTGIQLELSGYTDATKQLVAGFETQNNYGFVQTLQRGTSWSSYNLALQLKGGNVGIGTTSPTQKLQTTGNAILGDTRDSYVLVGNNQYGSNPATQFNPGYYVFRSGTTAYGMKLQYDSTGYSTAIFASNQASRYITFGRLTGVTSDNQFVEKMRIDVNSGNVGIGTTNPTSTLHVVGSFTATGAKNFEIDHPLKKGKKLVHASLEGPEAGVYYRGEGRLQKGKAVVNLPDYFEALVRKENRTVQLTAQGVEPYLLSCSKIEGGKFTVHGAKADGEFYWEVKAVRADIEPLTVEK
jgi:hypothetical protein